jgi:predicted site-specific integrase-resolvase
MYSIGIAATLLGVCVKTLRRWDKSKRIVCYRTMGGYRRFSIKEINRILNRKEINDRSGQKELDKTCAIYCRVSSHKQSKRGDLDRQIELLKKHAKLNDFKLIRIYKDIGSGLNTNRKGLWRLIQDSKKNQFSAILINYKDRLTRFGYKYLEKFLSEFNVKIICVNKLDDKTPESELVEDLVAIVHSFSGKLYRMKRTEKKNSLLNLKV